MALISKFDQNFPPKHDLEEISTYPSHFPIEFQTHSDSCQRVYNGGPAEVIFFVLEPRNCAQNLRDHDCLGNHGVCRIFLCLGGKSLTLDDLFRCQVGAKDKSRIIDRWLMIRLVPIRPSSPPAESRPEPRMIPSAGASAHQTARSR